MKTMQYFQKKGPNLIKPELTKSPSVIPKIYKLRNKKNNGIPNLRIEIPKRGDVNKIAGTNPIKVLIKAVKTNEIIISLIFIGAINRFVKVSAPNFLQK